MVRIRHGGKPRTARRYWQGFVRDARAERIAGDLNRTIPLTVTATGLDGVARRATLRSPVSPGWG